ncbi:MAG TPA: amidohydrolase family protein [Gemmatimonadaceae bacterium]|nr:amidohydrolase family protein [Gemmatimonadaceae bacterium]
MYSRLANSVRLTACVLAAALFAPAISAQAPTREYTVVAGSAPRDPTNTLPLRTTRIARFTVDEGTWMSLSVSPDGRTVMFDLLGDIYTIPIAGGKATRILGGNSMDVHPRFAPDGKRILFVSDRSGSDQLWVANADGSDPVQVSRLTAGSMSFPVWLPDGEFILGAQNLYHLSGGEGVRVPFGAGVTSFSPDGKRAYTSNRSGQIIVYDRGTGRTHTLVSNPSGALQVAASPDGKWLAYFTRSDSRTDLVLRDIATGDERVLRENVQHDGNYRSASLGVMPNPAWLPDASAILTTYGGKIWKIDVTTRRATMIPFSADVEQYMGPLSRFQYAIADTFLVRQIRDAVPSPDVKRLAFTALDKLYLSDLSGGAPKRVTKAVNVVEHSPTWSPDGRVVVFATWTDESGGDLYRVNADGSGLRKLTTQSSFFYRPVFSPDGKRLVFATGPWVPRRNFVDRLSGAMDEGPLNLAWMNADGGEIHDIVEVGGVSFIPEGAIAHFGPDTSRILFTAAGGLQSIRWDGSDRRTIYTGDPVYLSPTGTHGFAVNQATKRVSIFPAPDVGSAIALNARTAQPLVPSQVAIEVGAEFPGWSRDGKYLYFSLGRSFFLYDIAAASAARADSLRGAWQKRLAGDTLPVAGADTLPFTSAYTPARYDMRISVATEKPRGTVVLRGARIISMKGNEVIERGDVVVTDSRIVAVGPSGSVTVPAGAASIDVSGKTIVPGWVDVHAHTWPSPDVHKTAVPAFHANLAYGVTTMRDPQTNTSAIITYGDRLRTGDLFGPRFIGTGQGIFSGEQITTLKRAREVVRRYAEFYETQTIKQYLAGNRRTRQLVAMATYENRITPTTEGAGDLKMAMTEMLDGYAGHEHAYEIWPLYKDFALLSAASEITYTPTMLVAYGGPEGKYFLIERENAYQEPRLKNFTFQPDLNRRTRQGVWAPEDDYPSKGIAAAAARIVAAGGAVGVGAHHEVQGIGTPWDLLLIASGGMPNHDVLRVGTIFGARSIGLDRDLGTVEAGKLADLIVFDGNPLTDLRTILKPRYVMRNGFLFESETLNEVWPEQKPLPRRWWMDWLPNIERQEAGGRKQER